jgi:Ca-activated chloride channel family protein
MNREQAEKLLAALIFDDLDEPSKAELLAYLQTDDELRDRLADLRMAVKLTCDAVNEGPDPVLDEHRLEQLKRLAKTNRKGVRIFTMRRLLAAAAVLVFGLVLMGMLMTGTYFGGVSMDRMSVTLSDVSDESTAVSTVSGNAPLPVYSMDQRLAHRVGTDQGGNGVVADTGNGVYSGMGGYGGMGAEEIRNGAPATPDSYGRTLAGAKVRNRGLTPSDMPTAPPVMQPSSPVARAGHRMEFPEQLNRDLKTRGPMPQMMQESERVVVMDEQQPTAELREIGKEMRLGGTRSPVGSPDEDKERQMATDRMRADTKETVELGQTVQRGWEGTVTSRKPAAPAPSPPASDSVVSSVRKAGEAFEFSVGNGVDADKRMPVLGDKPIVGDFFRKSVSEIEQNSSKDLSDLRREAQTPSGMVSGLTGEIRVVLKNEPADHAGVILETDGASVPYSDEVTYPKNWREISVGQKADILPETAEAGLPSPSHFRVVPVNPWVMTDRDPLSTFALDVDTASYTLCRNYIHNGFLPPIGAVRMEEFINAFDYAYPQRDDATFAVHAEGAPSPFAPAGQELTLLKIAVKARTVGRDQRRAAHLVFVVDASASMGQADRLPLVQAALNLLVDRLSDVDRVSLVTCANEARLHLEAVPARQKDTIRRTINAIQPAGPTNLMAGLELGYAMARKAFVAGQVNQVVLCSDGVANVGQTEAQAVLQEVTEDRKQGITLTCVGVGYGAYNDAFLEALADQGDGRYVFLDSSEQAREILVGQLAATLQTVAWDARIQVRFNPSRVRRYRLIGYENRDIEDQRFRDDTIDAGEVGSGQCSTALYELELTTAAVTDDTDLGTVFVRYRHAETGQVEEISRSLAGVIVRRTSVEENPRLFLAAGAARFAEWLRQSEHARHTTLADVQRLLDRVSAALPLDRDMQDLSALAHQAENLPRAPEAPMQP